MSQTPSSARELLSWRLVLALSGGAWMLAFAFFRISMAALISFTGEVVAAPPPYLLPLLLALSAILAVGAARLILNQPIEWEAFADQKGPGPGLGATLALLAGLFLGAALGIILALRTGLIQIPGAPQRAPADYTELVLYLGLWLLPALLIKGADYLALRREQGR